MVVLAALKKKKKKGKRVNEERKIGSKNRDCFFLRHIKRNE